MPKYDDEDPDVSLEHVPNHLGLALFSTLCCCMPLGIAAIIYSAQVNSLLASGRVAEAKQASETARKLSGYAFGLGVIFGFIWMFLQAFSASRR